MLTNCPLCGSDNVKNTVFIGVVLTKCYNCGHLVNSYAAAQAASKTLDEMGLGNAFKPTSLSEAEALSQAVRNRFQCAVDDWFDRAWEVNFGERVSEGQRIREAFAFDRAVAAMKEL